MEYLRMIKNIPPLISFDLLTSQDFLNFLYARFSDVEVVIGHRVMKMVFCIFSGDGKLFIEAVYSDTSFFIGMLEVKRLAAIVTKFISLTDPSQRQEYVNGVRETIAAAKLLGCQTIVSQVGQEIQGVPRELQHSSIVEGLKACIPFLEGAGITLVIEPLNTLVDHPGYYLDTSKEAFQIVHEVGSPYIKVLYDIYHMQIMEGNIIAAITANINNIGYFELAGIPGRHEPYTGEIYYLNIFRAIEKTGYYGYVGMEYFPLENPSVGLAKFSNWIQSEGIISSQ